MGMAIEGLIEVRTSMVAQAATWSGVVIIDSLLSQNTAGFDSLFGVTGRGPFRPLASRRGIPVDTSNNLSHSGWTSVMANPSWITCAELQAADWDEAPTDSGLVVRCYRRGPNGSWIAEARGQDDQPTYDLAPSIDGVGASALAVGQEWERGGCLYRVEPLGRRETLTVD